MDGRNPSNLNAVRLDQRAHSGLPLRSVAPPPTPTAMTIGNVHHHSVKEASPPTDSCSLSVSVRWHRGVGDLPASADMHLIRVLTRSANQASLPWAALFVVRGARTCLQRLFVPQGQVAPGLAGGRWLMAAVDSRAWQSDMRIVDDLRRQRLPAGKRKVEDVTRGHLGDAAVTADPNAGRIRGT
jgi:hypothetical protein